jgi:hypothetical protein
VTPGNAWPIAALSRESQLAPEVFNSRKSERGIQGVITARALSGAITPE